MKFAIFIFTSTTSTIYTKDQDDLGTLCSFLDHKFLYSVEENESIKSILDGSFFGYRQSYKKSINFPSISVRDVEKSKSDSQVINNSSFPSFLILTFRRDKQSRVAIVKEPNCSVHQKEYQRNDMMPHDRTLQLIHSINN